MRKNYPLLLILFITTLFLQGCSSSDITGGLFEEMPNIADSLFSTNTNVEIKSNPDGATVFVMGKEVGKTPLTLPLSDFFPAVYPPEQEHLYGRITLKKEGCKDYTKNMEWGSSGSTLNAKLRCKRKQSPMQDQYYGYGEEDEYLTVDQLREMDTRNLETAPIISPRKMRLKSSLLPSMKERLQRIDELRQEGIITTQEYDAARKRILEQL